MRIAHLFAEQFRSWHRYNDSDLDSWMEVWDEAFSLAYFILREKDLAKLVATEAIRQLNEERPKRRHAVFNLWHYQQTVRDQKQRRAKLRKPFLPDHQYLDLLVFIFSGPREQLKTKGGAVTTADLDVWFIKCIVENSLRRSAPAFRMMLGVSSVVRNYDVDSETPDIWEELVRRVPRRQELWEHRQEPFHAYWSRLLRDIQERFGSLIARDSRGRPVRRHLTEQARGLTATCFERFKLRESQEQCLQSGIRAGNDNTAELMRLHAALHQECYASLLNSLSPRLPARQAALPEYTMKTPSSGGNGDDREPPKISEQEKKDVREELRDFFSARRTASVASLVITADGEELCAPSAEINAGDRVTFSLSDPTRLIQIWARQPGDAEDVLLAACPLAATIQQRDVVLEGGQTLSFRVKYNEDEAGAGSFEVSLGYRRGLLLEAWLSLQAVGARLHGSRWPRWVKAAEYVTAGTIACVLLYASASYVTRRLVGRGPTGTAEMVSNTPVGNADAPASKAEPAPDMSSEVSKDTTADIPTAPVIRTPSAQEPPAAVKPAAPSKNARGAVRAVKAGTAARPPQSRPSLAEMVRIYVGGMTIFQSAELNDQARESQKAALNQSSVFQVTEDEAKAQAILQVVSDYRGARAQFARAFLITRKGKMVLWQSSLIKISSNQPPGQGHDEVNKLAHVISQELITTKNDELTDINSDGRTR